MLFKLYDIKDKTSIEFNWDYKNKITQYDDILEIEPAHVKIDLTHEVQKIIMHVMIDVKMTLACSKTLKPVPYRMQFQDEMVFSKDESADFPLTDPIEISDILFGSIVSQKPYTIYHPDAKKVLFEKEKSPHPAFADLDKILKK